MSNMTTETINLTDSTIYYDKMEKKQHFPLYQKVLW